MIARFDLHLTEPACLCPEKDADWTPKDWCLELQVRSDDAYFILTCKRCSLAVSRPWRGTTVGIFVGGEPLQWHGGKEPAEVVPLRLVQPNIEEKEDGC